jgi:hypothetical protein
MALHARAVVVDPRRDETTAMRMLVAATALAACASMYGEPYEPRQGTPAASRSDLYAAAVRAVTDLGLTLQTNDRDAGQIVTEWDCGSNSDGKCIVRHRVQIVVGDGTYRIESLCQQRGVFDGPYGDCDHNDRRAKVVLDQLDAIARELDQARRAPVEAKTVPDAGVPDAGQGVDAQ